MSNWGMMSKQRKIDVIYCYCEKIFEILNISITNSDITNMESDHFICLTFEAKRGRQLPKKIILPVSVFELKTMEYEELQFIYSDFIIKSLINEGVL